MSVSRRHRLVTTEAVHLQPETTTSMTSTSTTMASIRGAAGGTLASVCMAGHVAAALLVAGPLLLLQLLGHVLATRFGASSDFLAPVLVAEPLMLVLLGTLGAIELGTGLGLLRWRPTAIPRWAVLASVAMLAMTWSSLFASVRLAMKLLAEPYPGSGQELLGMLHWIRLALAVARAMLVTWMVGKLAKGPPPG